MAVTQGYHLWLGLCMVESEKFVHALMVTGKIT